MTSHLLEDFEKVDQTGAAAAWEGSDALEDLRLKAFEDGYSAGWEDAGKAHGEAKAAASNALAQSLNDLSFTYEEALTHLSASMSLAFEEIGRLILPDCLEEAFPHLLAKELSAVTKANLGPQIELRCAPTRERFVRDALPQDLPLPLNLTIVAGFDPDRIVLAFQTQCRVVDLSDVKARILGLIESTSHQHKEIRDG